MKKTSQPSDGDRIFSERLHMVPPATWQDHHIPRAQRILQSPHPSQPWEPQQGRGFQSCPGAAVHGMPLGIGVEVIAMAGVQEQETLPTLHLNIGIVKQIVVTSTVFSSEKESPRKILSNIPQLSSTSFFRHHPSPKAAGGHGVSASLHPMKIWACSKSPQPRAACNCPSFAQVSAWRWEMGSRTRWIWHISIGS